MVSRHCVNNDNNNYNNNKNVRVANSVVCCCFTSTINSRGHIGTAS